MRSEQIGAPFDQFYRGAIQRMEKAALIATDRGARAAETQLRTDMAGAELGRLGQAIKATSDLKRKRGVHRRGAEGFSASGVVYVRSKSERTLGAIESYTEGADIRPRRGRWLWIATDAVPRLAGSNFKGGKGQRMTPALWKSRGFERKIGPLVLIKSINGYPLLAVKNVGVDLSGRKRSAKSLTKSGRPRKGQIERQLVVAFIGIPYTARAARIDVESVMREQQSRLIEYFRAALGNR